MKKLFRAIGMTLLCAASAHAGSAFFDFNSDPAASGLLTNYNNAFWSSFDGAGYATNANDGYLVITDGNKSQRGTIIFADIDNGQVVKAFTFEADLRIGNGTQNPADGFSVNYARSSDPVLQSANGGSSDPSGFAAGPQCEANLPEEGTQTGIAIGFDAWNSGGGSGQYYCDGANVQDPSNLGPDVIGISVRVDSKLIAQIPMPTQNGSVTDPTSLQTGPYDPNNPGSTTPLGWAHLKVVLDVDGKLSVFWKGATLVNAFQTAFLPSPGRLVFSGRTGDAYQNQNVDNISITTIPAATALVGAATGLPDGFQVLVNDSGSSVVDTTKPATAQLNGVNVSPLVLTKNGGETTVTYHGFPVLLAPGSSNYVTISVTDVNNNVITGSRSFTVPTYSSIPGADAVTGVNTTLPGFKISPWQSGNQPNSINWTLEQFAGLHGTNDADLTGANNGTFDYTGLINFNITPAAGGIGQDNGDFRQPDYPDVLFPGLPSNTGLDGSSAESIVTYLQFASPGLYQFGVNSDDGFLLSEGKSPNDWFANQLGSFNGPKGPSDVLFTVAVTNAGIYPVRLLWENGNGEPPGNGSDLEWFTIKNGVKYLVNDPSVTNVSGVKAFYSGPALPAYVAAVQPNPGATGVLPDSVYVQLRDSGTTVNGGSIQLYVNGTVRSVTPAKVGNVTSIQYSPTLANLLPAGSNTAAIVWSDSGGLSHSNFWSFNVARYATLDASTSTPLGSQDLSKPGFILKVAQIDFASVGDSGDGIANQTDEANAIIAGLAFPWYGVNVADPADTANGGAYPAESGTTWVWTNVVDFNSFNGAGDFPNDYQIPGIAGTSNSKENYAALFQGYLAFPAPGFYRMGVSSDDGFRISQGFGPARQVLHVAGTNVNTDVLAVVSKKSFGNGGFGGELPWPPISAPVVVVNSNNFTPSNPINLNGKIAVVDQGFYGASDPLLAWIAQTNGAIGFIEINNPSFGFPYTMTGSAPGPITIPSLNVNGFGGQRNFWLTNGPLTASIGASQPIEIGSADYAKGMGWIDFGFVVNQAGVYPMNLIYEQGGGGTGLEWSRILPDGTRVLVNDSTLPSTSVLAYRALTVQVRPQMSITHSGNNVVITYEGTLQSSSTVNGTYTDVQGASSPYTVPTTSAPMKFYRARF